MEDKRTIQDLQQLQALPLSLKVSLTKQRIRQWVNEFGVEGVYVSFSGGKDSTVLLHLVRELYPNVEAVFCDTGLEYPEIREFVKTFDNVTWLKPKMNFRKVIETYGYPFISKEVSQKVYEGRQKPNGYTIKYFTPEEQGGKKAPFNMTKWKYLLDAPFWISNKCCHVMKKDPAHRYEKETEKVAITGQMASESLLRQSQWLEFGCNAFSAKKKVSNPMSFWTEQDVLLYIHENHIPICSVYGDVIKVNEVEGQTDWQDYGLIDIERPTLKTTGCNRTGCQMCGYGMHLDKRPNRFELIDKLSNPKTRDFILRGGAFAEDGSWKPDNKGLGYWFVMKWINIHGNMDMYIPEFERYEKEYGNELTKQYLYGDSENDNDTQKNGNTVVQNLEEYEDTMQ